jgi:hypothetical protein
MYTHNHPTRLARTVAPTRFAAGLIATMALLTAACSDPTSSLNSSALAFDANRGRAATASGFTLLGNQYVSCTDGKIFGDVGTFQALPTGGIILVRCPVNGTQEVGTAGAKAAYNAFLASYAALAPQAGDICPIITGTLAGASLPAGTYCLSDEAKTGLLTLTGSSSGTWIFKVPAGALTGTSFTVVMAGGAEPCNVTWWVDAAATMTDSHLIGTILAGAGITLTRGTFDGNAYAGADGAGDVTVTGTTVVGCAGKGRGHGQEKEKCNQGVGNGPEACDPGDSNHHNPTNDEDGGTPGDPGRHGDDD